tara:strand:+ start:72 stop:452 length:381 start_codon:yes stop_codon:yes gene_type:complete
MYKILILLLLPLTLQANVTFKDIPLSINRMSDLNAQFYYRFKDWEEMQKDPDFSVEKYRRYIGTRCAGLYDYLTYREREELKFTVSLDDKVEFMEMIIKDNLRFMDKAYVEKEAKQLILNRLIFED